MLGKNVGSAQWRIYSQSQSMVKMAFARCMPHHLPGYFILGSCCKAYAESKRVCSLDTDVQQLPATVRFTQKLAS